VIDRWVEKGVGLVRGIDLEYPRSDGNPVGLHINLSETRAADPIIVRYDFDRDGWVILQSSKFEGTEAGFDADWQEVAFIEAWARDTREDCA